MKGIDLERVREGSRGRSTWMGYFGLTRLFKQKRQIISFELAADSRTDDSRSRWNLNNGEWLLKPFRTRSSKKESFMKRVLANHVRNFKGATKGTDGRLLKAGPKWSV